MAIFAKLLIVVGVAALFNLTSIAGAKPMFVKILFYTGLLLFAITLLFGGLRL